MPRGRKKGDHEARRVTIAEAACKVILKLGIANASLSDIAREMNYTTGVLRHYFADKDELLLFTKNLLFDRSHVRARRASESCEGIEKLRSMAREMLPVDADGLDRYRLLATFNGYAIGNARLMKIQHQRNAQHWEIIADVISGLQRDGVLSKSLDPRIEALGISAMIDGLADQVVMSPGGWSTGDLFALFDRHLESMVQGMPQGGGRKLPSSVEKRRTARGVTSTRV